MPIHDPSDEWRNESGTGFGTRNRLSEGENKGQVAGNSVLFQNFRGLDPFPSGGNLDKDPTLVHADFLVEFDDLESLGNSRVGIKGKTSIDFGGNVSRNNLGNLDTKVDGDLVLLCCVVYRDIGIIIGKYVAKFR